MRLTLRENGAPVQVSVYGKTAAEAERKARDLKTRAERGQFTRDRSTTAGYARLWLERKSREVRPRTAELYRLELGYALPSLTDPEAPDPLGSRPLQEVKPAHVREVLDGLMGRYSLRTVKMVRQRLWQVFRDALDMELVYRNPVDPVRIKAPRGQAKSKAGRALEPHEIAALLSALDDHKDPRTALALRLMLACGLRRGECLGLQWGDLDLEGGTLTVARAWARGGGPGRVTLPKTLTSARTVPIPHATLERLKTYRLWYTERLGEPRPGSWLLPGNDPSKPLDANAPNHALKRLTERLGINPLRVHDLRHSYGSHMLANGAPIELVAERMGHANPNITLGVYRHVLEHERRGWILDPEDLLGPRAKA
ncbi:MAG: site-specific integrase [Meiothermus sp.]|nr:MAG: site-specific integrase [Meiothermus sp.]